MNRRGFLRALAVLPFVAFGVNEPFLLPLMRVERAQFHDGGILIAGDVLSGQGYKVHVL